MSAANPSAPRPMGNVVGRQPAAPLIIPSNPNPWYGAIIEGERFTRQQLATLAGRGIDPATVETITVTRNATMREMWWPPRTLPPVYRFECPVVHHRFDGRVRVIAPMGVDKIVCADGWIAPPPTRGLWRGAA